MPFMSWASSQLATRRALQGLYTWKVFIGRKHGARELLTKEEKGLFGDRRELAGCHFFLCVCGGKVGRWVGMERAHLADYLIDTGQKIPDWLVKIMFLGEVETTTKSRFGIVGF